jgi:hypothetical protein
MENRRKQHSIITLGSKKMLSPARHLFLLSIIVLLSFTTGPTSALTQAPDLPPPETVTIAGTLQPQLGCSGEWNTTCEESMLIYDEEADIWSNTWLLPAGSYEYKAALN